MFGKLSVLEQIAVAFVVLGSIVDVIQFSWIIKRSLAKFKNAYRKKVIKEIQNSQARGETLNLVEEDSIFLPPISSKETRLELEDS